MAARFRSSTTSVAADGSTAHLSTPGWVVVTDGLAAIDDLVAADDLDVAEDVATDRLDRLIAESGWAVLVEEGSHSSSPFLITILVFFFLATGFVDSSSDDSK